eukprot:scaffold4372_cov397-Prasinococcus_capsulatus_cf.AAC.35
MVLVKIGDLHTQALKRSFPPELGDAFYAFYASSGGPHLSGHRGRRLPHARFLRDVHVFRVGPRWHSHMSRLSMDVLKIVSTNRCAWGALLAGARPGAGGEGMGAWGEALLSCCFSAPPVAFLPARHSSDPPRLRRGKGVFGPAAGAGMRLPVLPLPGASSSAEACLRARFCLFPTARAQAGWRTSTTRAPPIGRVVATAASPVPQRGRTESAGALRI